MAAWVRAMSSAERKRGLVAALMEIEMAKTVFICAGVSAQVLAVWTSFALVEKPDLFAAA
jgi:hypothetical protein